MLKTALDLGVRTMLLTPATELLTDVKGAVIGARVGKGEVIRARRGVVLASGGLSGDAGLRMQHFPHDAQGDDHFTPTVGHEGDAVKLVEPIGGALDLTPH